MRDVNIHNKQGEVICKIEKSFTWKDFLLSFTPISHEWANPPGIEKWTWEAAQQIADWEAKSYEPSMEHGVLLYDSGALCPACLNYSILPMIWRRHKELMGYSCITKDCPMRNVVIPKILVERIDERPYQKAPTMAQKAIKCIRCGHPVQRIYHFDGKKLDPPIEVPPMCICDDCWKDALCSNCNRMVKMKPHLLVPISRAPDSKKLGTLTLCDECYAEYQKRGEIAKNNILEFDEIEV